jgi:hypothetical protein
MEERIAKELELIKRVYPRAVRQERWILVPDYPLPSGWSVSTANVAFFIRDGYPGTGPYGVYVPSGLRHDGNMPNNFTDPASNGPPFEGTWAMFSWESSDWKPAADPERGHNLLNFVQGFAVRFREGV